MASGDLDPRRARAQLTRVLREVFGERPRRVERLAEGITNAVFRVSLDGDWVVWLNADPAKTRQFAKEQWAMERARRHGVPTPRVAQVGCTAEGLAYIVAESVPGQPASRVGKRLPLLAEMGRCAARLHRIRTNGFGAELDPAQRARWAHRRWAGCLDDELDAAGRLEILRRQRALPEAAWDELQASLDEMRRWRRPPVLQHGDLRLKNVIADAGGERVAALIDWEDCRSAPGPHWDLSIALHDLGVDEKEVFLDGYGLTPAQFATGARYVRALNLLNYAWAIHESRDERRLAWMRLRLKGGFDLTAA